MPAIRKSQATSTSSTNETTPTKGWSKEQKAQLFFHVVRKGETDWKNAVEGKTGQQAQEQWKKTLLPHIIRTCGF
ncbi:hypothetical protein CI109_106042 [Kwoniella shandongensis]|uniref:Uncharacterized protein n=1 Tax=Kwoniella shandongensis TaxID=1734106 RepID=A0A5M6C345_9TREE|nr:uncharacterized protein CI109_003908 [Kwoniella shandongensis]KAA5527649.1 hypothetical protein CI109_003908 [Kwoniella shandongensis]